MPSVLIVEDDKNMRLLTRTRLKPYYVVEETEDGEKALEILNHKHVDLIIADIKMPNMNGYEMVRELRNMGSTIPVIMITAINKFNAKRAGFASGTDDYMTKPINYQELNWRISALLRRSNISNRYKIEIGDLSVDSSAYLVVKGKNKINLSKKEFELLYKLLFYPEVIFTKSQLMDEIWGYDTESDDTTVKTHINRLRHKFKECNEFDIVTIGGLGYKAEISKT